MTGQQDWDLVVVGAGSAGIVGATTAAGLGARVLLVERARTGGDCLWTGCVPSKALIASAARVAQARSAQSLGVTVTGVAVDFPAVMGHVRAAIAAIEPVDSIESLEAAGVTVLTGFAMFTGPRHLAVDGVPLRFRHALIATGASPYVPGIPGLAESGYLTSDTLWDLTSLPARITVLGGGSIGCELGQALARLGAEVTIVEAAPRVLPREDPDASEAVAARLAADGVDVRVGQQVSSVDSGADGSGVVRIGDDAGRSVVAFDRLLVAVGRVPRTQGLGLDMAGVDLDDRGFVIVDDGLRSTNKHVWAAGDVTGHPQFTHVAGVHGSLAASNAVLGLRRKADLTSVPRVTFTDPEVAAVGVPTDHARLAQGFDIVTRRHDHVDRAVAEGEVSGFSRLAIDRRGRVVGATLVGPRAGEVLSELTTAVRMGLRTRELAATIHPYPTYSDGPWNAAIDDLRRRLRQPATARALAGLVRLQRWRSR